MREGTPYRNSPISRDPDREHNDADAELPIIDIVRHGETEYRELTNPEMVFDPAHPSFELTSEHLDLTEEGIDRIRATAAQLEARIDAAHEVVLVVSSPNYRAHSSALLIEEQLRKDGIPLFNEEGRVALAKNLGQTKVKSKDILPAWIQADREYRTESSEQAAHPPEVAYPHIAARLGLELEDIFAEDESGRARRFDRFLRHATNVYDWLSPETKAMLEGKRLRLVCVTHEEIPRQFLFDTLEQEETLRKGQVVEIVPGGKLQSGDEATATVTRFGIDGEPEKTVQIARGFELPGES